MDARPIGFFDSGLGGLTCIPHLMKALPSERIIYFGDTARTPYGSKATRTIKNFAFEITDFLAENDVKMIVIACNTVSATCLSDLRFRHPQIPILGIISPAAHTVSRECFPESPVGIIGTKATVTSKAYRDKIQKFNPDLQIIEKACPVLVPLIEEGITDNSIMDLSIKYYLDDFVANNSIETLVLGCTHYPLIRKNITRLYPGLRIIDPSEEILTSINDALDEYKMKSDKPPAIESEHLFYASDLSDNFINMINKIFQGGDTNIVFKNFDLDTI
jgi:glutamate racemase